MWITKLQPMRKFCLCHVVIGFWCCISVAFAQGIELPPSAPLGSAGALEQNAFLDDGTSATPLRTSGQVVLELCNSTLASDGVTAACEAAVIDLIKSFTALEVTAYEEAMRASNSRLNFDLKTRAHLVSALEQQAVRGEILFWTAMVMVALGLVAAALQFWLAWRRNFDSVSTEISISHNQISIKTAWLGVFLLAMSMGFLTLYLTLVYPIELI